MNIYDSERMIDILKSDGEYEIVDSFENCDVAIINTCHIREKASEKIFSELGKFRKAKQEKINNGSYMAIVIAGCVAQAEGKKIFKRMSIVDIVVGGESYHNLPKMVNEVFENYNLESKKKLIDVDFQTKEKFAILGNNRNVKGVSQFIAVQLGCDKFCSYCVVPYTRGREYSRPIKEIYEEALILRDQGIKEISLLGQNVDNYNGLNENGNVATLTELIYKINEIDGIERIRYTTSYPSQFTDDLVDAHRDLKKLMPHVHLPVQSGSNKVLKDMNRKYTREKYLEIINKLKDKIPNIGISSDFIVGFAGESEEEFYETVSLVEEVKFAFSFSFAYSPRPNTMAIKMKNHIPPKIQQERLQILQEILNQQQIDFNNSFVEKTVDVLVENKSIHNENYFGRTQYLQAVMLENVTTNNLIGTIVKAKIIDSNLRTLRGEIIK